jgi:hypothetical protein
MFVYILATPKYFSKTLIVALDLIYLFMPSYDTRIYMFENTLQIKVKPLHYVHAREQKISLYLLTRSLYLTWFVLNNEVHRYKKGPIFSVPINEVYSLRRDLLKRFYYISIFFLLPF